MSIKLVVRSSKKASPRLERVLAKMSTSARTPARPYQVREVDGTVVFYRPESQKSSSRQDSVVGNPASLLGFTAS